MVFEEKEKNADAMVSKMLRHYFFDYESLQGSLRGRVSRRPGSYTERLHQTLEELRTRQVNYPDETF